MSTKFYRKPQPVEAYQWPRDSQEICKLGMNKLQVVSIELQQRHFPFERGDLRTHDPGTVLIELVRDRVIQLTDGDWLVVDGSRIESYSNERFEADFFAVKTTVEAPNLEDLL